MVKKVGYMTTWDTEYIANIVFFSEEKKGECPGWKVFEYFSGGHLREFWVELYR